MKKIVKLISVLLSVVILSSVVPCVNAAEYDANAAQEE